MSAPIPTTSFELRSHPRRDEITALAAAIERGLNAPLTRVGAIAQALDELGLTQERVALHAHHMAILAAGDED